jgi:myo-inositol-1(or 4)-monophosphatase
MHAMLNLAVKAARKGSDVIIRQVNQLHGLEIAEKGRNDYVSKVDRMAESAIIDVIRTSYPHHAILAEESGASGTDDEYQWIIDPLDGTTNFLHGFPVFAVSIAVAYRGRMEHAVVYDPMRQEVFTASRGDGAQLDGRKIRVSNRTSLTGTLIGTGFPYRDNSPWVDEYLAMLRDVMKEVAGVRRPGAAALDLCYVANGRLDGFWEMGLNKWDLAAGSLIIREAGGRISDFKGTDNYLDSGHVVAGNPKIYGALSKILAPHARGLT